MVRPSPDPGHRLWIVRPGDNLSHIAAAVYGDPLLFDVIAEANGLTGSGPGPGATLIIPDRPDVRETATPAD